MAREKSLRIRLSDDEHKRMTQAADRAGFRHVSDLIRHLVEQAAQSQSTPPDRQT